MSSASSELVKRSISAAVLIPAVLVLTYLGGFYFKALVCVACFILFIEWYAMTQHMPKRLGWGLLSILYIALPCILLTQLHDRIGYGFIFLLLIVTWAVDTAAYISGTSFKFRWKLAPKISPKKTVIGALIGLISGAGCYAALFPVLAHTPPPSLALMLLSGGLLSLGAILGDLLESWVKRQCGVKDSGALIPGHGGLLDRLDSFLLVILVAKLLVIVEWIPS